MTAHRSTGIALVLAGYAVATTVMLAPICNYRQFADSSYPGDSRMMIWRLAWDNHALVDGVPSYFDANVFYPHSGALLGSEPVFGISTVSLPLYILTRNPVVGFKAALLAGFMLNAIAAYCLAWWCTRDRLASFFGGLAYAFSTFQLLEGLAGHLSVVWSLWLPISLIALEHWYRRPTVARGAALFLVLLIQALTSWYVAPIALVANAIFFAWLAAAGRSGARRDGAARRWDGARRVVHLAVAAALGLALMWPFAAQRSRVAMRGATEAEMYSARARSYLVPAEQTAAGQLLLASGVELRVGSQQRRAAYVGVIASLLAAIGVFAAWQGWRSRESWPVRQGPVAFFLVLALAGVALSLGPTAAAASRNDWGWTPFGLFAHLPWMNYFRVPARFAILPLLSISVLAAFGAAALHAWFGRRGRALTLVAAALLLAESSLAGVSPPQPDPIPSVYRYLASTPARAIASLPMAHAPGLAGTPLPEADYLYYSTAHWRPVVAGFLRGVPSGYAELRSAMNAFPGPHNAAAMRRIGADYLVLHTARYRDGGARMLAEARSSPDYDLVARFGEDYLFRIR